MQLFRLPTFSLLLFIWISVIAHPVHAESFKGAWRAWDTGYFAQTAGITDGGFGPEAFACGDMNEDGVPDVVLSHSYFGFPGITVMLGSGNGEFGLAYHAPMPNGMTVHDVELHDFDLDGDLDVFAAIYGNFGSGDSVGLWRNQGNGTLAPRQDLVCGSGPLEIELADVTGDGVADLVATLHGLSSGATVAMLRHNGATGAGAGFLGAVMSPTVAGARGLAVVDMNGDGLRDIVVGGDLFRRMGVGLNTGGGVFAAPVVEYNLTASGGNTTAAVTAADFDNDGDQDVATSAGGRLVVWRNDGTGALTGGGVGETHDFASPDPLDNGVVFSAATAYRLISIDIDADGWMDVLTANANGRAAESWNLIRNDGTGSFLAPVAFHCSQETRDIGTADVDADGDLDVLTVARSSNALTVHTNQGGAQFRAIAHPAPVEPLGQQIALGDLDLDGDLDAVTISNQASILRNDGDGTLVPDPSTYTTPINGKDVALVDLNGDGYPDLVLGPDEDYPPYLVGIALNDGDGSFLPGETLAPGGGESCGTGTLALADFDNDGDIDIALTEEQRCFGALAVHIFLFENDGSGSFTPSTDITGDAGYFGLEAGDFNNDGNPDLITTETILGATFTVYPGNGDMTFGPGITSTGTPEPSRTYLGLFRAADFNLDGILDVASLLGDGSVGTNLAGIFLGIGDGTFAASTADIEPGSSVLEALRVGTDIDVPDVDGDGDPDVVITNYASNDYTVLLNDGDGTLVRDGRYGANLTPLETAIGDLDGDGAVDLCTLVGRPNIASGVIVVHGTNVVTSAVAADDIRSGATPQPRLTANYPNPFNPATTIAWNLPNAQIAKLEILDARGRWVSTLLDARLPAGPGSIQWDGRDATGRQVPSGIYVYRLSFDTGSESRRMVLLK